MNSTALLASLGKLQALRRKKHNPASGIRPLGIIKQKVTSGGGVTAPNQLAVPYLDAVVHLIDSETSQPARTALPANLN